MSTQDKLRAIDEAFVREWFSERYKAGDVFHDGAEALSLEAAIDFARAAVALAAAQQAEPLVAHTSERHFALREAHEHRAEEDYFAARPKLDGPDERTAFRAGFVRGFDAGEKVYASPPAREERQAVALTEEQTRTNLRERVLRAIYAKSVTPTREWDRAYNAGVDAAWAAAYGALSNLREPT